MILKDREWQSLCIPCKLISQIEELKATLECERMYREQLEMRLDESSREVATLTMLLNEGRLTLKSKVQQHLDHQNTEKTNKFI